MALAPEKHSQPAHILDTVISRIGQIVLGKERQARLSLACLLARGHLLIEDLPGVGKTTLAHVLAKVLGLQFQRIQVTADGVTHKLPQPFFVIATQNPHHLIGTFPLPESQLDRFLMRIEMGYPDRAAERALLKGRDRRELVESLQPVISADKLASLQQLAARVHVAEAVL